MALEILLLDLRLRFISKLNFNTDYIFFFFLFTKLGLVPNIIYGNKYQYPKSEEWKCKILGPPYCDVKIPNRFWQRKTIKNFINLLLKLHSVS